MISVLHGAPNTSKLIIKARDKCETVYNPFLKYIYHAIMYLKEELVKASIRYNCSHCEKYVLLSSHFIKPLSDYAHIKRTENIIAIGNPVTIPVYFEEWELKQKKKQLLYVGRMDYENKRVNRIVEAWKVLYEKYVDWELVWWEKALIKVHWKNILEDMIFNVFVSKAFKYLLPYNIIRKLLYFIDF